MQNFDGYWLVKYLTENILMDDHCLSPYTCKCCTILKQFGGLNFDGLAGKRQKHQNFPHQKFLLAIRYFAQIFSYYASSLLFAFAYILFQKFYQQNSCIPNWNSSHIRVFLGNIPVLLLQQGIEFIPVTLLRNPLYWYFINNYIFL